MSSAFDNEQDDLDRELLAHFAARFPRPSTLSVCDYDVDPSDAVRLCAHPRAYANARLMSTFMSHIRWAMFGDWRDLPAFTGDITVYCRRESPTLDGDLGLLFVHLGDAGAFDPSDAALLRRWVEAVLLPWAQPTPSPGPFVSKHLACAYLALLTLLGGRPADVLSRNLERSKFVEATRLCRGLGDRFDEDGIRTYFEHECVRVDNQRLPPGPYIPSPVVETVVSALRTYYAGVPPDPYPIQIDPSELEQQLDSGELEQIDDALTTLEGCQFHGYGWPKFESPSAYIFSELESPAPPSTIERYLSVTAQGSYMLDDAAFEQTMAVFGFGDGGAARAFARMIICIEYLDQREQAVDTALSTISWIFSDHEEELAPPPVERVDEFLRILLDAQQTRERCRHGLPQWICDGMPLWGVVQSLRDSMSTDEWSALEREAADWLPDPP